MVINLAILKTMVGCQNLVVSPKRCLAVRKKSSCVALVGRYSIPQLSRIALFSFIINTAWLISFREAGAL
jgi:hypothetical protein